MQAAIPTAAADRRVLFASLVGTSIEYFDFYAFATAAVIVFPKVFFPQGDATSATLQSLTTFILAFFARPLGAVLFGHFGDRLGRKATLVSAPSMMGVSTVLIGILPGYASVGALAPALLALCRLGQGLGLGGEWGGALLLATENAPAGKRAWYGMFPQLGAPVGFVGSAGVFLLLRNALDDADFIAWGWRLPFLTSAVLIAIGLHVRLRLTETREFAWAIATKQRVQVPMLTLFVAHGRALGLATLAATATFSIFYLMTVFALSWATSHLGYTQPQMLLIQVLGMSLLAPMVALSAVFADRSSPRSILVLGLLAVIVFGACFGDLLGSRTLGGMILFTSAGLGLAGLLYGPQGTALAELFPTPVRYSGISLACNLASVLGASLTLYIATWLATTHGLASVGLYLSGVALLSLIALLLTSQPRLGRVQES
jgi:MFS family permease